MQAKILAGCCILGLGIGATSVALGQKTEPAPSPAPAVIAPAVRLVQGTWSCGSPAVVTVNVHGGSAGVTGTVRISGGGVTAGTSQGFTIKAGAVSAVTVPTAARDCHLARYFTVEITFANGARHVRYLDLNKLTFRQIG